MLRKRTLRRSVGASLVVAGGLFMWLATETILGVALLAAGVLLEIAGLVLEHRAGGNP